jgi:hypothetical protein
VNNVTIEQVNRNHQLSTKGTARIKKTPLTHICNVYLISCLYLLHPCQNLIHYIIKSNKVGFYTAIRLLSFRPENMVYLSHKERFSCTLKPPAADTKDSIPSFRIGSSSPLTYTAFSNHRDAILLLSQGNFHKIKYL